jgi:uncharacterized membrane protein
MKPTHIHLLLNHVSIMAALFFVLIFFYGLIRSNETAKTISYVGFVLAALAAIPVFLTGEPAEDAVEKIPGVLESAIEKHEEEAEAAIWLISVTGILALGSLLREKISLFRSKALVAMMIIVSLASAATISYTGYLGGQIRHTEIASGTNGLNTAPANGGEAEEED